MRDPVDLKTAKEILAEFRARHPHLVEKWRAHDEFEHQGSVTGRWASGTGKTMSEHEWHQQPLDYEKVDYESIEARVLAHELYGPRPKRWWEKRSRPFGLYFWLAVIGLVLLFWAI